MCYSSFEGLGSSNNILMKMYIVIKSVLAAVSGLPAKCTEFSDLEPRRRYVKLYFVNAS